MDTFVSIVVMIVPAIIIMVLIIGLSLGIGWVLGLFLPFSLFEGTLLGMMATITAGLLWNKVLSSILSFGDEDWEDDLTTDGIPGERFWRTNEGRTWENWFRFILANSIYEDLGVAPQGKGQSTKQRQELAIQLADAAVAVLRGKPPKVKRLRVSKAELRDELTKKGRQPSDDDTLRLAVAAVNGVLVPWQKELRTISRRQLWDEPLESHVGK